MANDRPNILVVQADQLATQAIGAYGSRIASTPHLDELVDRGTIFDNAYCNFPLCAPSRFSMMAGQLASSIDAFDNGAEFPSSIPTFAHYLRALDYQTCLVGKMHFVGADQLHGFEQRLTTDIYPGDFGWTGDWTEARTKFGNDAITFTDAGVCDRNAQIEYDEEVCHRAKRKIYDLARGADDRPFLLFTSFTHPHDPYQCREEHWNRYRHDDIPMPRVTTDQADMDPYSRRLIEAYGLTGKPPSDEQVRIARHAYFGSVSYFDDILGELLAVLRHTGMADNTVVIVTTDHGEMLGEHGLWYKKTFFEDACRIPLILSHPALAPGRIDTNVSLIDLLPTLLDIAGDADRASTVESLPGSSLLPIAAGDGDPQRAVYAENLAESACTPLLMARRGALKYVYSAADPDQLFDLVDDPDERHNLIEDPTRETDAAQMKALIDATWDADTLNRRILLSQKRRLFLRSVYGDSLAGEWEFSPEDELERHCLRADRVYNNWAYGGTLGLRVPKA